MIFFIDTNSPTYRIKGRIKELFPSMVDASDEGRITLVAGLIEEYWDENGQLPKQDIIESLATFILRPYIGNKEDEYKILSVYSLERREANQVQYFDDLGK